jgi:hypothetical protein
MKLSKEQRSALESALNHPYGSVCLICDGRDITLQVQRFSALKYRVMTFVDGTFKGAWTNCETPCPEQKYLRKSVRNLYPPAARAKLVKEVGKKFAEKIGASKTLTMYWPDWPSGKAALGHLCKVCDSVEIATPKPGGCTLLPP